MGTRLPDRQKDLLGGAGVALVGLAAAWKSVSYNVGTLQRMGPGYVPLCVGVLLTVVGTLIALKSVRACSAPDVGPVKLPTSENPPPRNEWRAWTLICSSLVVFIVLTGRFGLAAGAFGIVFVAALADRQNTWRHALMLATVMTLLSILVFWWGLHVEIPLFVWSKA